MFKTRRVYVVQKGDKNGKSVHSTIFTLPIMIYDTVDSCYLELAYLE